MRPFLTQLLHRAVQQCPDREAVISGDVRLDYAALTERVSRLAAGLRSLGLQPGARVGLLALNSHRYVEALFAVWWAGGVVNPVNIRWTAAEVAYSLDDCDTQILLVDEAFAPMVAPLRERSRSLRSVIYAGRPRELGEMIDYESLLQAAPIADALRQGDELAAVMYTGGTTGRSKGVMLGHAQMMASVLSGIVAFGVNRHATSLLAAPLFHIGGCSYLLQTFATQRKAVLLSAFDERLALDAIERERISDTFLVPTMLRRLIAHPQFAASDVSSVRQVVYGAAPMDEALLNEALAAFPEADFYQAYGMTECAPLVAILPPHAHKSAARRAAGLPVIQAEVRVVDEDDVDRPVGEVGEIIVRSPSVMQGYWMREPETEQALRGGFMHTGDGGYFDRDGYLHVVDRMKDMIITGGENVYSAEVENALSLHPSVMMAAVIGIPDARFGESVHAVVVLRAEASEVELIAHCRSHIAAYKCPRSIELRSELPLSPAGKILKYQLREPHWSGAGRRV